jgi:hypothetical protein
MASKGNTKHGMGNTRIYSIWKNMKRRCDTPTNKSYADYGGRGIIFDPRWAKFEAFYEDMFEGYADNLTLDRKDVNGNYCKENCRWLTIEEQQRGRRDNMMVEYNGVEMSLLELYDVSESSVPYKTVYERIFRYKWTAIKALTTPIGAHKTLPRKRA